MAKEISLNRGFTALVDDEDFELLSRHTWTVEKASAPGLWYASAKIGKSRIRMHQMILGKVEGKVIHHDDHNGLNNQKSNLKRASFSGNSAHQLKQNRNTSGFKGVTWDKKNSKWQAQAGVRGFIGRFKSATQAAKAYDNAALKKWGEFAMTNRMMGLIA